MKRRVCAALAAAVVSTVGMMGGAWPTKATAVPAASLADEAPAYVHDEAHSARLARFAGYLEERRSAHTAPPASVSPFVQLDRLGLDGTQLSDAVEAAGLRLGALARFDLSRIDVAGIDPEDRRCLTQAIYYEARNQSLAGQMAVADVVLNRVEARRYPGDVCGVVFQGSERRTGCQFSFTCDGSMEGRIDRRAMTRARTVATAVLGGFRLDLTDGATNYHANYVSPYWAPTLAQTAQVGDHLFYRRGAAPTRFAMLD